MSMPDYSEIIRAPSGQITSWTDTMGGFHWTHIVDVSRISATTERKLRPTDTVINQQVWSIEATPENDPAFIMTMAIVVSVLLVCVSSIFYIFNDAPAHIHAVQEIDLPTSEPWSELPAPHQLLNLHK